MTIKFPGDEVAPLDEAEMYERQMHFRVENLLKLVKLNAPRYVIAHQVLLVMRAAVGFCGDDFGRVYQDQFLKDVRRGMQRCVACGKFVQDVNATDLCEKCLDEMKAEDERDGLE